MKSKLFSLSFEDFLKGFLMAVLSPIVAIILDSIGNGQLHFDWKLITAAALGGGLGYIKLKFLSNNADELLTRNRK